MKRYPVFFCLKGALSLLATTIATCGVFAQEVADSLGLPDVVITERYSDREIRSTVPVQILSQDQIPYLHSLQLSDAVKHFSGVTIKDYGGIGGLKTISVRSLGAHHTAVLYNGISINDVQTGQIDIGRFSLENVELVSLYTGQNDQIFMPASAFSSASSLVIQNVRPRFNKEKRINGKTSVKTGSFGLFNPSLHTNIRLTDKLAISTGGEWMKSHGEYPYLLRYGNEGDSTSMEKRTNTDVDNLRLEGAIFADLSNATKSELRAYYYQSKRGLPGATIFYNTQNYSRQRLWDRTFFVQGNIEHTFSSKWIVQGNAKYNRGYLRYLDPAYLGAGGKYEDIFNQHETYGALSVLYRAFERLSFSASSDLSSATMHAERNTFATPTRLTSRSVIAAKWVGEQIMGTANLLYTQTFESVRNGEPANNRSKVSPYLSISVKPFPETDLRVRAFYKNSFRLPTFNDLYYPAVGTRDLLPEDTDQLNIGITYAALPGNSSDSRLTVTLDAYRNQVRNKIVAFPTGNLHQWAMINVGKVTITGMDFSTQGTIALSQGIRLLAAANYTYQSALDKTNPNRSTFNHQIAYTPRHSGSGRVALRLLWIDMAYTLLWSGDRYYNGYNSDEYRMKGYSDHALSVSKDFPTRFGNIHLQLEALNLLDKNYQIVRNYPMPGRSFRINASLNF